MRFSLFRSSTKMLRKHKRIYLCSGFNQPPSLCTATPLLPLSPPCLTLAVKKICKTFLSLFFEDQFSRWSWYVQYLYVNPPKTLETKKNCALFFLLPSNKILVVGVEKKWYTKRSDIKRLLVWHENTAFSDPCLSHILFHLIVASGLF